MAGKEIKYGEEARKALLKVEKYKLPKSPKGRQFSGEKSEKGKIEKDEIIDDIFEWICEKYQEYLNLSEEKKQRQSYFFQDLENRGVSLKDLNGYKKTLIEWLNSLNIYSKRLEKLTEEELKTEMKFSFLTFITKQIFESKKNQSGDKFLLGLVAALFKTYKAARKLEKRKSFSR